MHPLSFLYVPADRPERLAKAGALGADAIIADLEDAVAPPNRRAARAGLAQWLATGPGPEFGEVWVRVNPWPEAEPDIAALADEPRIAGFYLAKTNSAREVRSVVAVLERFGSSAVLVPVLESAAAVLDAREIAQAPRVHRLQLGEADLRAELGVTLSDDGRELLWVRSQIVLASAAVGLRPPVAPVDIEFRDLTAFARRTRAMRDLGFRGRACIHPAQLPIVAEVFRPGADEIAAARRVLEALAASDGAATVTADGVMVDEAVARQARRVLQSAGEGIDG